MPYLITQRHDKDEYGRYRDMLENSYVSFFERQNLTLIPIPNVVKDVHVYADLSRAIKGIVLSGGNDA